MAGNAKKLVPAQIDQYRSVIIVWEDHANLSPQWVIGHDELHDLSEVQQLVITAGFVAEVAKDYIVVVQSMTPTNNPKTTSFDSPLKILKRCVLAIIPLFCADTFEWKKFPSPT